MEIFARMEEYMNMTKSAEERERWTILKQFGADKIWQPTLDEIINIYNEFSEGVSGCNITLLVTERNYFHDFYQYLLNPAFPEATIYFANVVSGSWFKKNVKKIKQKIMFLKDEINWIADRYASKKHRIKSLKNLLQTAQQNRKFLILCGNDFNMPRFKERLSLAYISQPHPEVKEVRLKPLP